MSRPKKIFLLEPMTKKEEDVARLYLSEIREFIEQICLDNPKKLEEGKISHIRSKKDDYELWQINVRSVFRNILLEDDECYIIDPSASSAYSMNKRLAGSRYYSFAGSVLAQMGYNVMTFEYFQEQVLPALGLNKMYVDKFSRPIHVHDVLVSSNEYDSNHYVVTNLNVDNVYGLPSLAVQIFPTPFIDDSLCTGEMFIPHDSLWEFEKVCGFPVKD